MDLGDFSCGMVFIRKLYVPISDFANWPDFSTRSVILVQLFIAVINENFHVAEETKREQQVADHYANTQTTAGRFAWLSKLNPYKYTKANPKAVAVENLPSNLVLPLRKAIIQNKRPRRQGTESSVSNLLFNI